MCVCKTAWKSLGCSLQKWRDWLFQKTVNKNHCCVAGYFSLVLFFFFCSEFCHTLKWNSHGFTCVPHPNPPTHLPLHPLPLSLPSAPGRSACLMYPTWAGFNLICFILDNIPVSMLFSWNIPPSPSPTESKRLFYKSVSFFFFCSAYRVIINIFLNSIYMC